MAEPQTKVFRLVDIHCEACEERIRAALMLFPGVKSVRADRRSQQVEVRLDADRTTPEQVAERLEYLGFPLAAPVEEPGPAPPTD